MSLIDRFRSGSELNSVGHFTLDEKRAKDKMARFQLVQLEDFILLVAQAANAAQCTRIDISIRGGHLRFVAAGTQGLDAEELGKLEDYLFNTSKSAISYYLVGVARNAVIPFCQEEPTATLRNGTFVFELQLKSPLENMERHVRKHLLHCPCRVSLNGRALNRDPLEGSDRIDSTDGYYSHLFLVRYGVIVGHKEFENVLNFRAVVQDDGLKMDASFSDVVEDETYQKILERVKSTVLEQFIERIKAHEPGAADSEILLRRLSDKLPEPALQALHKCPLFPLADCGDYVDLHTLKQQNPLYYSPRRLNLSMEEIVVLSHEPIINRVLQSLFNPFQLVDVTGTYLRKLEALRNKERWQNSPRPLELPPNNYIARRKIEGKKWQAEIGFIGPPGGESHINVLLKGKLLCTDDLEDVPPGAVAVLNLEEAEVDEMWTRVEGRAYRSAIKKLKGELAGLFNSLRFTEPKQLYPELKDYLEQLLIRIRSNPPAVALKAPLLEATDGRFLSIETLKTQGTTYLGEQVRFSDKLPQDILPENVLLHSVATLKIIQKHLFPIEIISEKQARLKRLDYQLNAPIKPRLTVETSVKRKLSEPGLEGEIGLQFEKSGPRVRTTLLYRGAEFESFELKDSKAFATHAIVESNELRPNSDWSGFVRDDCFHKLVSLLKASVRNLEEAVLDDPSTSPEVFLKALKAYPKDRDFYWEKPLFQSTTPGRRHSLAELEAEIEEHDHLLRGPMGVQLEKRLVLLQESHQGKSLSQDLLLKSLPSFTWKCAAEIAEKQKLQASFLSRQVHQRIEVPGEVQLRYSLKGCLGEVGIGHLYGAMSGSVLCYFGGRFICPKKNLLPEGCAAAIDSEELELSEDFNDANIPEKIQNELLEVSERGLLDAAKSGNLALTKLAYQHAMSRGAGEGFLGSLDEISLFDLQEGGRISISELANLGEAPSYVTPDFPKHIKHEKTLLRLTQDEVKLLRRRLKSVPINIEAMLYQKQKDKVYLASLEVELPSNCKHQRSFKEKAFSARIAITPQDGRILGLDEKGKTLGYIVLRTLPAVAVVTGAKPGKRDVNSHPTAELSRDKRQKLKEWICLTYLDWGKQFLHKPFGDTERAFAISTLNLTKQELGGQRDHAQAALAKILWRIPLFPRVDGTWVSGENLAQILQESEEPLAYAEHKWRAPGSILLLDRFSDEFTILRSVLGDKSLRAYEAPPLVDSQEIKRNIQRLAAWGVSPLAAVKQKIDSLVEFEPPGKQEKKKETFGKKRRRKKQEAPKVKTPPEQIFLQEMKTEAKLLLGPNYYYRSDALFQTAKLSSWVLGPPVYLGKNQRFFTFNLSHPSVRWLICTDDNDKVNGKARRLTRVLLVIYWVGLVNIASEELKDDHEREFLEKLAERVAQTFS